MPNKKPDWYEQAGKEPFKRNHFSRDLAAGVKSRIDAQKLEPSRKRWYWGAAAAAAAVCFAIFVGLLPNADTGPSFPSPPAPSANVDGTAPTPAGLLANVPIRLDWEKEVKEESVFTASAANTRWLLLTSEPALGQMGKTLYRSDSNGKTWTFVNDVSQIVDGYVTGVTFRDGQNGWISATQHGKTLVPLFRTKDGGKSWSPQAISVPAGYNYGNAYPPVFNEKDVKQGTLKIEFVSDTDKKTEEFRTTDGGETWTSASAAADTGTVVYTNQTYAFQFTLPERWKGYTIVSGKWDGLAPDGDRGEKTVETGPLLSIRDPLWTAQTPRQDIPIMVFTVSQWNSLQEEKFHIGAAPIGPSELGRNETYVFALPARYNFAFPAGYEEVDQILQGKPLKVLASK